MKLIRLTLSNFKGQKELVLNLEGADTNIFADNGVGKTTIVDAFFWLLFGKDSQNSADFEIKTRSKDGEVLHGLSHEVTAVLETGDGKRIELQRCYKEDYVQKRGNLGAEFKGHETTFWINGVPVQKKEYQAFIEEICPPKHFRILTDPTYFSSGLHWQDRRRILMDLIGDVSDSEIIDMTPELFPLTQILGDRTIDAHRKVLAATMGRINEELRAIPVQMAECERAVQPLPQKPAATEAELATELAQLHTKRTEATASSVIANLNTRITEIGLELKNLEAEINAETVEKVHQIQKEKGDKSIELQGLNQQIRQHNADLAYKKQELKAKSAAREQKLAQFNAENARTFAWVEEDTTCRTCGQALPTEGVAERKANAEAEFNQRKATNLGVIKQEGILIANAMKELENAIGGLEKELELLGDKAKAVSGEIAEIETRLASAKSQKQEVLDDPRGKALADEREAIKVQIDNLRANESAAAEAIDAEIRANAELRDQLKRYEITVQSNDRQTKRHAELEQKQKELAAEFERMQHEMHLTDEFIRAKVRLLTDRINSRFGMASFQLFETQINGGLTEVCEATFNGVPYGSLNHGSKINVGLDIIQTLGAHLGFTPTIFIDNAESITAISPTEAQQIRLIVSAADRSLRVESAKALVTA